MNQYSLQSTISNPLDLINDLLSFENDENNNLIQILGIIRPSKSSQTSITSLVRGLFTKNKNLLKVLNGNLKLFDDSTNGNDDKQVFKSFVNDFILWINDDILLLFEKYSQCLQSSEFVDHDSTYFNKPILHLLNYISFIESSVKLIRNPYILEQLNKFSSDCKQIVDSYTNYMENSILNNINFNNVQIFGDLHNNNVCSYFKLTQIVERTRSSSLVIKNLKSKPEVELLLLDLNNSISTSQQFNALALIAISGNSRYLMFPPFRINEVSLSYSKTNCQIILKSINFIKSSNLVNEKIVISCPDDDFLANWIKKLSLIFPLDDPESPLNSNFLIKLSESDNNLKMSGLGIDMSSEDIQMEESETKSPEKPAFKELINSPTLKPNEWVAPSISTPDSDSSNDLSSFELVKPQTKVIASHNSSPASSAGSVSSVRDPIIEINNFSSQHDIHVQNIRSGVISESQQIHDRPVSSSAEIETDSVIEDKENFQPSTPLSHHGNHSVPELSSKSKVFQLSTGSAIDISNFGKSHNPSFSVHRGLNEMIQQNERPKSKFFGMFKKPNKTPKIQQADILPDPTFKPTNPKNLRINTDAGIESDSDTIPLSASSVTSGMSTISQDISNYNRSATSLTQHKNASGSAFALPSSTSTYFFKPYKNTANNESASSLHEELDLVIPQELKDVINDDSTIDFYLSPTSPKSMKVSKWKPKYGKWEMLTVNETVFLKLVVNYDLGKSWMLVFKEEFDDKYNEVIDKPILLLDISQDTDITQSSALDVQISSKNCITNQSMLVMIRCFSNELTQTIVSHVKNVKGAISPKKLLHKSSSNSIGNSRQTIASSIMDGGITSKSSTMSSVASSLKNPTVENKKQQPYVSQLTRDFSMVSISSEDINNATILNNPDNTKLLLLNQMTVRLQKKIDNGESFTSPSSWKILSMYSLSVHIISDTFSGNNYYSFTLVNNETNEQDYGWLICEDEKLDRIERIGKAGLLINATDDDLFMIECKGKREFKELYEVF